MTENLHTKLIEKLVNKKFEFWKEEFVKKLKEDESDRIALMKILKLCCDDNDMIEKKEAHKIFIDILEKRKGEIDKIMGSFNQDVQKDKGCGGKIC